jgi:hypothetical protein
VLVLLGIGDRHMGDPVPLGHLLNSLIIRLTIDASPDPF